MRMLPIDSIPAWCPTWDEIKSKAHLYQTARLRSTGQWVKLCGVTRFVDGLELTEPVFRCRAIGMAGIEHRTTQELCAFGL